MLHLGRSIRRLRRCLLPVNIECRQTNKRSTDRDAPATGATVRASTKREGKRQRPRILGNKWGSSCSICLDDRMQFGVCCRRRSARVVHWHPVNRQREDEIGRKQLGAFKPRGFAVPCNHGHGNHRDYDAAYFQRTE